MHLLSRRGSFVALRAETAWLSEAGRHATYCVSSRVPDLQSCIHNLHAQYRFVYWYRYLQTCPAHLGFLCTTSHAPPSLLQQYTGVRLCVSSPLWGHQKASPATASLAFSISRSVPGVRVEPCACLRQHSKALMGCVLVCSFGKRQSQAGWQHSRSVALWLGHVGLGRSRKRLGQAL